MCGTRCSRSDLAFRFASLLSPPKPRYAICTHVGSNGVPSWTVTTERLEDGRLKRFIKCHRDSFFTQGIFFSADGWDVKSERTFKLIGIQIKHTTLKRDMLDEWNKLPRWFRIAIHCVEFIIFVATVVYFGS